MEVNSKTVDGVNDKNTNNDIPVNDNVKTNENSNEIVISLDDNGDNNDIRLEDRGERKTDGENLPGVDGNTKLNDNPVKIKGLEQISDIPIASDSVIETNVDQNNAGIHTSQPITRDGKEMDPDIRKSLEKYLADNGIRNYTMTMKSGSNAGDNNVAAIAKVKITGVDKDGSSVGLNWIVKISPPMEALRKMIRVEMVYEREVYIHQTVFPTFRKLEDDKLVVDRFTSYPEFLFSYMEPYKESFVMNDITSMGYVLKNKKEPLNLDHVILVMRAFGKFHALSYGLKHNEPDVFETLTGNLKDIFVHIGNVDEFKKSLQVIVNDARATLDPVKDALLVKKFSLYADNFMEVFVKCSAHSDEYSVIVHGDGWINNMMFKYGDSSRPTLPTSVCLLDFQCARYASPACDLSYFLFACTDKAFRDEHYDAMIKLYYNTLCAHLNDLGCDPEKYLPFDALQMELRRFSVVGLHMSLMALIVMMRETEEIGDWEGSHNQEDLLNIILTKSNKQDMYNERVRNIIIDFVQYGYFDEIHCS